MRTIESENQKTYRKALDVLVGLNVGDVATNITCSATYDDVIGDVEIPRQLPHYMDLCGDGFLNDGEAVPLPDEHDGIILPINTTVTITADEIKSIWAYVDNKLTKLTRATYQSIEIPTGNHRYIIACINDGESIWLNNDRLISCNLNLRAVETKIENPELQMSEIEFKYVGDSEVDYQTIPADVPIYYTSGYPNDMSPLRKFYMSDTADVENGVWTIKGTDATRFLDDEYAGIYLGNTSGYYASGLSGVANTVHNMLTNSGIEHTYELDERIATLLPHSTGLLIPAKSKRQVIAQLTNVINPMFEIELQFWVYVRFRYVDAGIPTLSMYIDDDWDGRYYRINNYADWKVSLEKEVDCIEINWLEWTPQSSATIQTITNKGTQLYETSDPYYSFSSSGGTITKLSPYKYKVKGTGTYTISGRKIVGADDFNDTVSPFVYHIPWEEPTENNKVTLDDMCGIQCFTLADSSATPTFEGANYLRQMLDRGAELCEFTWRGNPKLQPGDLIRVNGNYYTIESITLDHEGGGLTSTMVCRGGDI